MLIGISGMIGSGKSVLTKKLMTHYKSSMLLKEFEEDDEVFNQFLEWLYNKTPNLTIGFQSYVVENHTSKLADLFDEFNKLDKKHNKDHIFLDRFSIEHYIFASVNLSSKGPKYMKGYDSLFTHLITKDETPDLAIYLDMTFETFKKRLFSRGRNVETDNYAANEAYFRELHSVYRQTFERQAKKFNMDYIILDTNNMTEQEVFEATIKIIEEFDFSKKERFNK
ncbi:deoxynucleoside kinase [Mycoplasma zalophidermidis]|uniref:Deoxynucleoside kinase n=1 Tax=Mycoplasma zalophidermidis TaxID=398174 RepID=A0ABS6DRL4_9MOLU|nr:deoxynucleoside kinase [Mycoplasma zalophidermidis]MBU4693653.1 deoxynucleoside kinase [Mycoplasma zalophidermidis]